MAYAGDLEEGVSAFQRKDYPRALTLLRPLAEQGNAIAQLRLADMLMFGNGVPPSAADAARWVRIAADQGNAEAQFKAGILYLNGNGVASDQAMAIKLLRASADQGYARGQSALGYVYMTGTPVLERDTAQAMAWLRKAAEQDDPTAPLNLGNMYFLGVGVPRDEAQAEKWYRKAADKGDPAASQALSLLGKSPTSIPLLHRVAEYGDLAAVRSVVEAGADVDTTEANGLTALMIAANTGKIDIVRFLLEKRAAVRILDRNGWSALAHAAVTAQVDIMRLLLAQGADPKTLTNAKRSVMYMAVGASSNPLTVGEYAGNRPVLYIKPGDRGEAVRLLVDAGLAVDAVPGDPTAPILAAARASPDAVRALIERGARIDVSDQDGKTLLMFVAGARSPETVRLLLEHGADPNARSKRGATAFLFAGATGDVQTVRILLERNVDVNARNPDGTNALQAWAHNERIRTGAPANCESEMPQLLKKAGLGGAC
jgi:ankyrin repeat protein